MIKKYKKILGILLFIPLISHAEIIGTIDFGEIFPKGKIEDIIKSVIDIVFWTGIVIFPLMILFGAFYLITSGGIPEKINTARKIIIWAIVGLLIVAFGKTIPGIIKFLLKGG